MLMQVEDLKILQPLSVGGYVRGEGGRTNNVQTQC